MPSLPNHSLATRTSTLWPAAALTNRPVGGRSSLM